MVCFTGTWAKFATQIGRKPATGVSVLPRQNVMPTNIERRSEAVQSPETRDSDRIDSLSGGDRVTTGAPGNRETSGDPRPSPLCRTFRRTHIYSYAFFVTLLISLIVFKTALLQLARFSDQSSEYSYIPLIPLISAFLISVRRKIIFERAEPSRRLGICIVAVGMVLWFANNHFWSNSIIHLDFSAFSIASTWSGLFVLWYGRRAARLALLPLSLLLFVIPVPENILNVVIQFLQHGSTVVACELFRLVGVPVLREGTSISLPRLTVAVAPECSGIRSSISLLILALACGHLYLRAGWTKVLLVLAVVPLAVVKNAIRIVTLSLLAVYVDEGFLNGPLHHRGGIFIFLIATAILSGIVLIMQWLERRASGASSTQNEHLIDISRRSK